MKKRTALRLGAVIIAVAAGAFALTGSAGAKFSPVDDQFISPVADQIAYMSTLDGEADIYTMAPTGMLNFNLTHDKTIGLRADVEPAWSPDGQYVAFQRNFAKTGVQSSEIFVVAADGTKLGPLMPPTKGVIDMHPTWSPDGQSIVFASDRDGNFELYMYSISSGDNVIQLTDTKPGVQNVEPTWSPNGEWIAFTRQGAAATVTPSSLYLLMVEKGAIYKLTPPAFMGRGDHDAAWSPDSTRIAFTSDRLGSSVISSNDLFVVNVDGSGLTRVTTLTGNEVHPTFSPYGDQLAFVGDQTGATELYSFVLPAPTSAVPPPVSKIQQLTFDGAYKSNPTWHGPGIGMPPTN
jgi:Tol biopolymer transport system component